MAHVKQFEHLKVQLEAIQSATNNFADESCIGKGGFGKVYKGKIVGIDGNAMVAVKRLDRRLGQGDSEFWKEIMMLSLYKHTNIVSLLGFCGEKILVYEYLPNKSLDLYLNNDKLTWIGRLKICIGAARGLAYLHSAIGTQQRVLHRDIKSSNILLDDDMNAKISDWHTLFFSLTQNNANQSLVGLARKSYEQNTINDIVYNHTRDEINRESLQAFVTIAYQCLKRDREERPLMSDIMTALANSLRYQTMRNNQNPVWKETFKFAVEKPANAVLRLSDSRGAAMGRKLGMPVKTKPKVHDFRLWAT
ncbi:hypothetical protein R6Q57_015103 [Mikania cordata]